MLTGPSIGPGMLLTVLMRWPGLIVVFAICGSAAYAYKEYGLPESVELAWSEFQGKPVTDRQAISDSDKSKVVDLLPEATRVVVPEPAPEVMTFSKPDVEKVSAPQTVTKYWVVEGDSLSKLAASRSKNPKVQRALVQSIFNNNQHAFRNNDPNHLSANVEITIPVK